MKWKANKGFTLIELLTVVAIIGIAATIILTSFLGSRTKSKNAKIQTSISHIRAVIETGFSPTGGFVDITTCGSNPCGRSGVGPGDSNLDKLEANLQNMQGGTLAIYYYSMPSSGGANGYAIYAYFVNQSGSATASANGGYICYDSGGRNKTVMTNTSIPAAAATNPSSCQ